jgi:hypothetical protein
MRNAIVFAAALVAIVAAVSPADAASTGPMARSRGECVQLANERGWKRVPEFGRFAFIRGCRRGKFV